jgi:cytochrome c553
VRRAFAGLALLVAPFTAFAIDAEAVKAKAETCAACHGPGGNSTNPQFPSLAAQVPTYVQLQLIQFREGRRSNPVMSPIAANISDAEAKALGEFFAAQPPKPPANPPAADRIAAGQAIAQRLHCNSCHMPNFAGQKHIPRIASQHYDYLVKQLRGFKSGTQPDIDGMMTESAQPLTDPDIVNVAAYLASLP